MALPCFQYHCWLVSHIGWWNVTNEASYKNPGRGDERWFRGSWLSVSVPLCSTVGAGNPGDRWEVDLLTLLSWSDAQRNAHTHTGGFQWPRMEPCCCVQCDNCLVAMPRKAGNRKWHNACPRHTSHLQKLLGFPSQLRDLHAEMWIQRSLLGRGQ